MVPIPPTVLIASPASISLLEHVGVLGVVGVDVVLDDGKGVGGWGEVRVCGGKGGDGRKISESWGNCGNNPQFGNI